MNIHYERFLFHIPIQESNESTDACVTRFRKLAASCDFSDIEVYIIDQIFAKCHSSSLCKKLFQKANLNLDLLLTTQHMT